MSAASLGVGEHVTTGNTQYSMVSGNNYKQILKNDRECVALPTLGHTLNSPEGIYSPAIILATRSSSSRMLSSTLRMNASLGRLSLKMENGNEVWANPTTPLPSNVTVASHSKEDVTPRIVVSVSNCMETSPVNGRGHGMARPEGFEPTTVGSEVVQCLFWPVSANPREYLSVPC